METSLEIYRNEEGAVLFRSEDGVFKRPFDFGKGLIKGASEHKIKIDLSKIDADSDLTVLEFNYRTNVEMGLAVLRFDDDTAGSSCVFHSGTHYANGSAWPTGYPGASAKYPITATATIIDRTASKVYFKTPVNKGARTLSTTANFKEYQSSGGRSNSLGTGNTLGYITIFDKAITDEEFKYIWRNGNGNFPATTENVYAMLVKFKPEILDFSLAQDGSDMRVGFRDISGKNNHGSLTSLPVGTLEEQVSYMEAYVTTFKQ